MRRRRGQQGWLRGRYATVGAGLTVAALGLAALSSSSVAAPAEAPANTAEPVISGMTLEGQVLSTSNGSWSGTQPMTFSYRWVRCGSDGGAADGSNCSSISGATGKTYTLKGGDVGFRLRVRVTASNSSGSARVASNPTSTIAARRPTNVAAPTISGSAVENATLQASTGAWTGQPTITYSYRWLRCNSSGDGCQDTAGATASSYVGSPRRRHAHDSRAGDRPERRRLAERDVRQNRRRAAGGAERCHQPSGWRALDPCHERAERPAPDRVGRRVLAVRRAKRYAIRSRSASGSRTRAGSSCEGRSCSSGRRRE